MANQGTEKTKETGEARDPAVADLITRLEALNRGNQDTKTNRENFRSLGKSEKITQDVPGSKIVREDHPPKGGGWVVETPKPLDAMRMGVEIRGGIGIIDEALPDADTKAHWLEHDYGYKVTPVNERDLNKVRRLREGVVSAERVETTAEKLMSVGQAGIVRGG